MPQSQDEWHQLIQRLHASGRKAALAITDLNNLFGAVKFYKTARGAGVKPVIGAEVWIDGRKQTGVTPLDVEPRAYLELRAMLTEVGGVKGFDLHDGSATLSVSVQRMVRAGMRGV